jgi:hypothetical protein
MSKRDHCKKQITRLGDLYRFPFTKDGRKNIIDALDRWTVTGDHATKVVDKVLETMTFCPSVAELRTIAFECRPDTPNPSAGCTKCNGTGYVQTTVVRKSGPFAGERYDVSQRCECFPTSAASASPADKNRGFERVNAADVQRVLERFPSEA